MGTPAPLQGHGPALGPDAQAGENESCPGECSLNNFIYGPWCQVLGWMPEAKVDDTAPASSGPGPEGQGHEDIGEGPRERRGACRTGECLLLPGEGGVSMSGQASRRRCPSTWVWKAEKVSPGGWRRGVEDRAEGVMPEKSTVLEETDDQ